MAPRSSTLAWEIPQTEGFVRGGRDRLCREAYRQTEGSTNRPHPRGYSPWGCERAGLDLVTKQKARQEKRLSKREPLLPAWLSWDIGLSLHLELNRWLSDHRGHRRLSGSQGSGLGLELERHHRLSWVSTLPAAALGVSPPP